MKVRNATKMGYIEVPVGGVMNVAFPKTNTRRGRVIESGTISPTIDCGATIGVLMEEGIKIEDIKIRRLTPRECFRLQGFGDEMYERAEEVNNDMQLYKQAGNSVTVNVIYEIARRLND